MRLPARTAAALLASLAAASPAPAATCPSNCVTFDDEADAEKFVELAAGASAGELDAFLKERMAKHVARLLPNGTQFVLLSEHKVAATKSSFYGIHLPGAVATSWLVAVK
jgi:hypothetical protein